MVTSKEIFHIILEDKEKILIQNELNKILNDWDLVIGQNCETTDINFPNLINLLNNLNGDK